jgi:hypothetical protein
MADEDRALFEAALSDEPPATEAVAVEPAPEDPPAEQEGQPRDEHGRFAPKAIEPEAPAPAPALSQPEPQPDHRIPLTELLNEREKRQKFERELEETRRQNEALQAQWQQFQAQQRQQQQPKPEVPDIFENPQGYQSHIEQTFNQRMREQELNFSLRLAHVQYKKDFEEAYAALNQRGQMGDNSAVRAIVDSPDPGEALMRWHRQQKLYEATGGDLEGYLTKRQEELLKDPAFLAKAVEAVRAQQGNGQNGQRPAVQLPPSLSRIPSAAASVEEAGGMSDAALFAQALR